MDVKELEALAARELTKHGLHDWTFVLANTKRRLGACKFRAKRIEISDYYARNSPPESVLDTLLHEIAHALAGPDAGHGPAWKAVAIRLGAAPHACETTNQAVLKPGDWQATCPACDKTYHLYRQPRSLGGYRCKCEARSPLTFVHTADPGRRPVASKSIVESARWEAECAGCGTVHLRNRRPKAGVWRCKCPQRCEIAWRPRTRGVS